MSKGNYLDKGPKQLQFGDVVSGSTSKAKAGDKTYSKAVGLPEGATTRSGVVYDGDGNRIGKRVAASTPKYVPDTRNAGSRSKQAADYINRSRGKTKAEMEAERRERERNATTSTVPRQSAEPDGPPAPSTPSQPRRRTPAPEARRPAPRMEKVESKKATTVQRDAPKKELMTAKAKPSKPEASAPAGKKTRAEKIVARGRKRAQKVVDRRAKRADVKSARAEARNIVRGAKGKPMKKRMVGGLGAAAALGGAAGGLMQNSDNPTVQKIGQGLSTVSNVAGMVGGKAAPAPAAAKYGKMKGKKGMMKYKAGGAKPDYLDMDKDGNKKESMKKALKDRRSRGGYGKKKRK